jgi:hypothetical protein
MAMDKMCAVIVNGKACSLELTPADSEEKNKIVEYASMRARTSHPLHLHSLTRQSES